MKYETKLSLQIFIIGTIILSIGFYTSYNYNYKTQLDYELGHTVKMINRVSSHFEQLLLEKTKTNQTLSIAPIIKNALISSNNDLSCLSEKERIQKIDFQSKKWKSVNDENDPFIHEYTDNKISQFLKEQQSNIHGDYGEIFLTNKYGSLVASTAKLSTYSHAHKYWWKGAYNNGLGTIFFDDRGYDESVGGYVLGIVIPIKEGNDIIGILKVNLNILGAISDLLLNSQDKDVGKFKLIRSGGEVIFEEGLAPLSSRIPKLLYDEIQQKNKQTILLKDSVKNWMIGMSEIGLTSKNNKDFLFGGSFESIDHKKGNSGESWYIINYRDMDNILEPIKDSTFTILIIGFILIFVLALAAYIFGKHTAKPIKQLIEHSEKVAKTDFTTQIKVSRNDEIGLLGEAFNEMTKGLYETTTSIENLKSEVEQRILAEEALKVQYGLLERIMNKSPFGIYLINLNHELEYINPVIKKDFGPVNGQKCYEYFHDRTEKCPQEWCLIKEISESKFVQREHFLDKTNKTYMLFSTLIKNPKGKVLKYEILQDITEQKEAEQKIFKQNKELQELNATKDKFFSIIAHDLRSPFNTLLGFSNLLHKEFDIYEKEEQKKYIDIIHGGINNTFKLLENLLIWSLSQKGTINFNPEKMNLYLVANHEIELLSQTAKDKLIRKTNNISEDIYIEADKNMLSTIIRNIISNAIKFSFEGGEIILSSRQISTKTNQEYIEITIQDYGLGISKEIQSKLFNITENTTRKGTKKEKGTGLGLILCKEFIDKHNGNIWVESEPNKGSKFIFTVPKKT
ncbi:MAG: HAMP domain-containing protein [Bacteroidetes bacterium]|jgi:signal transduction histidine kinase/HAMP domain-containing protein|nr:HAMP domain-containing protein [Bacteroidota bacterium]MBT6686873.1 HAMP domain-containing protein [Bacteroidota bacterium]MBT7145131.1 HAMP domain-containing protein [Bacteroidota bacterium]MBT7493318.1 HAMP domain-containing protein [Bacteroidota bacterium]